MSLFLRVFAIAILATLAVLAGFQYSAASWPQVEGKVLSGRWAMEDGMPKSERGRYLVEYEYVVGDTTYRGRNIGFAKANKTSVPILNEDIERQPREGDTVKVSYVPFWKDYSLLRTEPNPSLLLWAAVGTLVSVTMLIYARINNQTIR